MANKELHAGSKLQAVPKEPLEVGIDRSNSLTDNIINAYESSSLDTSALENFTSISQSREQIYQLIDTMANDDRVASVLETYAEDICEPNDRGEIVWCESADPDITHYVSFLLDSMNIDKNIYKYAYSLCKYGDVYWRLFRQSDYKQEDIFRRNKDAKNTDTKKLNESIDDKYAEAMANQDKEALEEGININYHSNRDHYVRYIELVANPGEMYELLRYGKTMGFIKAPTDVMNPIMDAMSDISPNTYTGQYKVHDKDVDVFQPTDFVHAALEDNSSRTPEEVNIYLNDADYDSNINNISYTVRRGQSLLYTVFKIWRELSLLESSIILNRLTKASAVRIVEIEVGDMPKEKVQDTLRSIKSMVEQKSALNTGKGMAEYTNPGPVENTIYVPTKGEIGRIQTQELGAESADPKSLADLEYFLNKFYAALRVPKQFFAQTDDGAGFNGGSSLSIISSRYGKAVKRIQNALIQGITDIINLMLLDSGLDSYVNKFMIKMQTPMTQEVIDRREQINNDIGVVRDLMQIYADNIEDPISRLSALKITLANASQDPELVKLIQEEINRLSAEQNVEEAEEDEIPEFENDVEDSSELPTLAPVDFEPEGERSAEPEEQAAEIGNEELPSFEEMGVENPVEI